MSRGYTNYSEMEPYTDGWVNTTYSGTGYSDHVCRPVVVDAEGRKSPIIRYASGHNTEEYQVMKAERIVKHISHAAPIVSPLTNYRKGELGSPYDRPEKVGDFLNEVSRPISSPFGSNWRAHPNLKDNDGTAKYVDDSHLIREPQTYKGTNPMFDNKAMYNRGPMMSSHSLSKPTNNIGSAVDFLAEAINPPYGGKEDFMTSNNQTNNLSRPIKTGPLSSIHWRTGTNLAAQDRKVDSGEDELDKPKEQQIYGRNKKDNIPRLPTNPYNSREVDQKANGNNGSVNYIPKPAAFPEPSQQTRFPAPKIQNKGLYSSPETIDSSEARKRYGKLKSQSVPEETYTGSINSTDAVTKYGGAKIPW
ncbi:hypothetical protein ACH5RR_036197 [Cinchona calisaya]|uniref:Uncharacterized protein n=1 Tax=Cinchona calisaya TaxID=153742 RepID=A0ABD2Y2N5_9GENT